MKIHFDRTKSPSKRDSSLYEKIEEKIIGKWGTEIQSPLEADLIISDFTKADATKGYLAGKLEDDNRKKLIIFYRELKGNDPKDYISAMSQASILEQKTQKGLIGDMNSEIKKYVLGEMKKAMRLWMYAE